MRRAAWLILVLTVPLTACTAIWAQAISGRVTEDLLKLPSYEGKLVERGLLADPKAKLVKTVRYERPWKVRIEVTAPKARAGDLSIYDGETLTLWWPKELFGIRVRGLTSPTKKQIHAHLKRETKGNLEAYAFNLRGEVKLAGQPVAHWRVIPKRPQPHRLLHEAWMHGEYSFPMRMTFFKPNSKTDVWYDFRYETMAIPAPKTEGAFAFDYPPNAVVFEWDWRDPEVTLAAARKTSNFTVRTLSKLPKGFTPGKTIKGRHDLPMIASRWTLGASWIALTQNRNYAGQLTMPVGLKVRVGERPAFLNFMGSIAVLSWTVGDTQLTLMGNLSFPQLIEIARGVE